MVPRWSRLPALGDIRYSDHLRATRERRLSELAFEQQAKADAPDLAK
jgi:hypothetical protein